jgi:hypothetical protein
MDPRIMTLTVASSSSIPLPVLEELVLKYTSPWPSKSNATSTPPVETTPTTNDTPTTSQKRWKRQAKENARRRKRIRRGNRKVFWLPNGTFPGGWFYGVPNFSKWEKNETISCGQSETCGEEKGLPPFGQVLSTRGVVAGDKELEVSVSGAVERGFGFLAGYGPTPLGRFPPLNNEELEIDDRKHPLVGFVSLTVLKEVINQKLYHVVREERQVAYDANFQLHSSHELPLALVTETGKPTNWYTIAVTTAPDKVSA